MTTSGTSAARIGIFGTFDVENWGDLLFPLVARAELVARLGSIEVIPFSYRAKPASSWFYDVRALESLPDAIDGLDAILIGGGHLIRFDKMVAPGYHPNDPRLHHPTSYWLLPAMLGVAAGIPVIWNGPSASRNLPAWAAPLLGPALRHSSRIAVRDSSTRDELARFAPETTIHVIPDTAFGITRVVPANGPASPEFNALAERIGLRPPYILLQASARASEFTEPIKAARAALPGHQFVEIEIGPEIGDRLGHHDALALASHIKIQQWPSPPLLAEIVARSSGVIATSLHLSLTALAYHHPVLRPAEKPGSKYALLEEHDTVVPMTRKKAGGGEKFAVKVLNPTPSHALPGVLDQLATHWDKTAALVRAGRLPSADLGPPDFLMRLPFYLEQAAKSGPCA